LAVAVRNDAELTVSSKRRDRVEASARATAEIAPQGGGPWMPGHARGGGYSGPLAYRQGKPMRPDVATAFDRMAAAARAETGLTLLITSSYRSDAEQARLFAAHPDLICCRLSRAARSRWFPQLRPVPMVPTALAVKSPRDQAHVRGRARPAGCREIARALPNLPTWVCCFEGKRWESMDVPSQPRRLSHKEDS
jgi:hypothetical protein